MDTNLTTLREGGHFYEAPRWRDGSWWVSDFYAHHVLRVDPDGQSEVIMKVDQQPSGLGWLPDGSLLVVSMRDAKLLRRSPDGSVSEHCDFSAHVGGLANDMVVDDQGRAWVGNFGFDLMGGAAPSTSSLVRVDPDGTVSVAATDLYFPNGSVITPDGRTLIVGETLGCRYSAFDIADDGSLTNRRIWAEMAPLPTLGSFDETLAQLQVAPDGCGLAGDGGIWFADALGGRVARVVEGGSVTDEIPMPEGLGAFACAVGGDDGRTLLICAAPDFFEHERAAKTEAMLFTVRI